jgi:nitroreductase
MLARMPRPRSASSGRRFDKSGRTSDWFWQPCPISRHPCPLRPSPRRFALALRHQEIRRRRGRFRDETWAALEEALVLAPSTFGLQPWKFVVVHGPRRPARGCRPRRTARGSRSTAPTSSSSPCARTTASADIDRYMERGPPRSAASPEEEPEGLFADIIAGATSSTRARQRDTSTAWMSRQVYIALGQFMAAAALLGVDVCPMEGIVPAEVRRDPRPRGPGILRRFARAPRDTGRPDDRYAA